MSVPEHIGPYRVLRPIATGGTAEVYEVQDPASGERFALKLLVAVATSLKRFNREYEAMIRLNHPSIVRVYHYGLHQGQPWLTMELLRGQPAQVMVKRVGRAGSAERSVAVHRVGYHVAKALHYIHDRKIVHRDLKSANVLVLPDDRIKLLDFGAAALLDATERITLDGEFVGTFAYASPEQLMGRPVDHRSDLYSLGVLLYRLATGARPFESDDNDTLARMHIHQKPPDPRQIVPDLHADLATLIDELLAKSPNDRPPTADHVAQRLEAMHGRPFSTRSRLAVHEPASVPRETERRRLWDHLVDGPAAACVMVDGEDGSDRVRFLENARAAATARQWGSYTCQVRPGQGLQRVVDALVTMAQDCDPAEAGPLVEALRGASTLEALASTRDRAVLRQTAAALARLRCRGRRPAILVVQEVHRGDVLMLELLGGLRRALQGEDVPFKLVMSCRTSDVEGTTELVRRIGEAFPIKLLPLTPRDVAVAVGNMLGRRPPPAELARRLFEVSAGQPLYLEEAVQDMVDAGGIEADGSRLAWADQTMEIPPPTRAVQAADKVIEMLPVIYRRVLEALAVADDATEPSVVARALGWSVHELGEVMDKLVGLGVLRWTTDNGLRPEWRQPILAALVGEAIHPCRRAVLRRALANAVRGLPPSRGGVKALVALGRTGEAVGAAVGLARSLLLRGKVRSALEVVAPVVERAGPDERGPDFAEAFLLHARCLRTVQPTDPAGGKSLVRARALAEEHGDPGLLARASLAQARLYEVIGHYANFLKYLKAAWDSAPKSDVPALGSEIASALAQSYRWHGDLQKAEQWVEQAVEQAELSQDPPALAEAMIQSASCKLARGVLPEAEEILASVMQIADRADHKAGFWSALAKWGTVLRHQGRFSEALSQLYLRLPEASQSQDPTPYTEMLLATAWIELDLSRLGRAQECTDELAATIHRGEHLHLRLEAQLLNGRILLASGQYRSAQYILQEVHRGARSADLPVLAEHARALLAETLFAVGDKEAAAGAFQSAVLGLLGTGDLPVLAEGLRGRARTEATERDPDEIFKPVAKLLDQPMPLLRLEKLLAKGAWCRSRGDKGSARSALRESAIVLNKVATDLNDTDRAALRVHPWSAWIRAGLR